MLLHLLLLGFIVMVQSEILKKPVDLSHYYDNNTRHWPNGRPFKFIGRIINEKDWYASFDFETAEHGGTHLDAPYHFYRLGWKVGDIPLERFIAKAVYLDLRSEAYKDPDFLVGPRELNAWERVNGPLPAGSVVLLDFGWSKRYNDESAYFGTTNVSDTSSFHFPGLSAEGAQWLANSGKVFGIATDTASIDYGQSKDFPAHRILAKNKIYGLEHVALPDKKLPASGYQILALPMKLRRGTGAPCRVLAIPLISPMDSYYLHDTACRSN